MSAYPFANETADRYFVKTSITLKTYLRYVIFGVMWFFGTLFNWRRVRQFLMKLMKCSVTPG